jgi:cytoskeletal protein RodZ
VAPPSESADLPELPYADQQRDRPARLGWIPELVAVAALVSVLLAAVVVFSRRPEAQETTAPTTVPSSTVAPDPDPTVTTAPSTTEAPATTVAPTTSTTRPAASGATGVGELRSCRRSDAGVAALVGLRHRSGPASRFEVTVALVDESGSPFAEGRAISALIPAGGTGEVEVEVPTAPGASGACEIVTVRGV